MTGLIRQLKLHGLVGDKATIDGRAALVISFFDTLFDGLHVSIIPDYAANSLIFHKGEIFFMEQDFENGLLWCRYKGYWSYFRKDLGLAETETQAVIKTMVENHLRQQVGTPENGMVAHCLMVENHLRQQVQTPAMTPSGLTNWVENHLRQHIKTPQASKVTYEFIKKQYT